MKSFTISQFEIFNETPIRNLNDDVILSAVMSISNEVFPIDEVLLTESGVVEKSAFEFLMLTFISMSVAKAKSQKKSHIRVKPDTIRDLVDVGLSNSIDQGTYGLLLEFTSKPYSSYFNALVELSEYMSYNEMSGENLNVYHSSVSLLSRTISSILNENPSLKESVKDQYDKITFELDEQDLVSATEIKRFYRDTIKSLIYYINERLD